MPLSRVDVALVLVVAAAFLVAAVTWVWGGSVTSPPNCPIPAPPIPLYLDIGRNGEMVFFVGPSQIGAAVVGTLSYELATYLPAYNRLGPGDVILRGSLSSLNETGELQFHDLSAVGELSPGKDFFILEHPPEQTVQLRILGPDGTPIAWNMITGCI